MKLLDYIRGLRKGKEAHRLEKESMKDPFLADAMDGYGQVEGNHEQRIGQLRMQVSARATKKRNLSKKQNSYAVTWSIAACLVIGIGISCYFLFLKKRMTDDVFIAKEEIPSAVFEPISPKEEISSLAETKIKQDSTHEVTATPTDKKDIVAKSKSIPKTQSAPVAITPVIEETVGRTDIQEERIVADTDTSLSEVHQLKAAKAATPNLNLIKGKVTDEKGEPIIGASVAYTGTNIGTVTDLNGEFILKKEKGNKQLTAQFIGYEPVEIPVDTSRTMLIAMNEDQKGLSEVVVVGHGVNKKANKDNTPQPVDGKRKYLKYLKKNLVRPTDETCAQVKGKVVLINIFATWCGPCQSELAEVQKTLWPKYKDNKDFCMLVIGREHTDVQLTEYNKRKGFTFPLYPDPKREVTGKFASQYIPRSYLIDKEGKVISATVGYKKEEMDKLMKEIDKALK